MNKKIVIELSDDNNLRIITFCDKFKEDGTLDIESIKPKFFKVDELTATEKKAYDAFVKVMNSKL